METAQNSTAVCIAWQPPYPSRGLITSYSVSHWLMGDESAMKTETLMNTEESFCTAFSSDVKNGQEMVFSVRAHGRLGSGPGVNITIIIGTPTPLITSGM